MLNIYIRNTYASVFGVATTENKNTGPNIFFCIKDIFRGLDYLQKII